MQVNTSLSVFDVLFHSMSVYLSDAVDLMCFDRCQFSTFEQCQEWLKRLNAEVRPPSQIEELFSFAFHAWCVEKEQHGDLCRPGTV